MKSAVMILAGTLAVIAGAVYAAPMKSHSLTANGADVRLDGARITASATEATALNLPMTMQIGGTDDVVVASSGAFTFTSVDQTHSFFVSFPTGTFTVGQEVNICITDVPGATLNNGNEGWCNGDVGATILAAAGVFNVSVPAGSTWSWLALGIGLGLGGLLLVQRRSV